MRPRISQSCSPVVWRRTNGGHLARRLIVWGASGHAKVVADLSRLVGWEIVGFLDDIAVSRRGEAFFGSTVLGTLDHVLEGGRKYIDVQIALGVGENEARLRVARLLADAGFGCVTLIHPNATIAVSAQMNEGIVVAAGGHVGPDVLMGRAALVNTGAVVDHDCILGDGCHIAPHATLGGAVSIGVRTFVGANATVLPRLKIGSDTIVGAGSVVTRDLPDGVVAVGGPARVLRSSQT